jgi:hypothetical protein
LLEQRVIDEFADFQRLIEGCIDLEAAQNNEYQINASFDPEFTQWCEEKEQAKQKIDTIYRAVRAPSPPSLSARDAVALTQRCGAGAKRVGGGQARQGQRGARKLQGPRVAHHRAQEGTLIKAITKLVTCRWSRRNALRCRDQASTTKMVKSKRDWSVLEDTAKSMRVRAHLIVGG